MLFIVPTGTKNIWNPSILGAAIIKIEFVRLIYAISI